jgi:hypothetical protein
VCGVTHPLPATIRASYGPPYNTSGTTQKTLFAPADILGVTQPINAAHDFVLSRPSSSAGPAPTPTRSPR